MNEGKLGMEHGNDHVGEEAIKECLNSKRIGFKEISSITAGNVFSQALQGETFIIPDDKLKVVYEDQAKHLGREDLKFEIEKESSEKFRKKSALEKGLPEDATWEDICKLYPEEERVPFIKEALAKEDVVVPAELIDMIKYVPEEEQAEIRSLVFQKIKDTLTKENKNEEDVDTTSSEEK